MATVFEAADGNKYVLPDKPKVQAARFVLEDSYADDFYVQVDRYTEPQDVPAVPAPAAVAAAATMPAPPVSVDDLETYRQHNGDEPHADPKMRCQCGVCPRVDGRA